MDISQLMQHITVYEEAIADDVSLSTVQTLTTLYQKAIEYFSALDDQMFNDILNRMQSLLLREDIQIVLNSIAQEKEDQRKLKEKEEVKQSEVRPVIDFNVDDEDDLDAAQPTKVITLEESRRKQVFQIASDEEEHDLGPGSQMGSNQFLDESYDEDEAEEYEEEEVDQAAEQMVQDDLHLMLIKQQQSEKHEEEAPEALLAMTERTIVFSDDTMLEPSPLEIGQTIDEQKAQQESDKNEDLIDFAIQPESKEDQAQEQQAETDNHIQTDQQQQ